jgi:uncharacterized protein (DUF433 family)
MPRYNPAPVRGTVTQTMTELGVYTLSEAARYTGVPPTTLRSWFLQRTDGRGNGPLFQPDHPVVDGDFAISFVNLIEAYTASFFRKNKVKPRYIRRAHEILKEKWGIAHPFASEDLRTDGRSIIAATDTSLTDVIDKQLVFESARPYLLRIDYDPATQLASNWNIAKGIVINPNMGFGKPVIESAGVSTLIVAHQYIANRRDAGVVARLFGISPVSVINAYEFERKTLKRIAA